MTISSIYAAYGSPAFQYAGKSVQKSAPNTHAGGQSESIEISDVSAQVGVLRADIVALPEIRLDIVKSIKARIQMNDYPIENNLNEAMKKMHISNAL